MLLHNYEYKFDYQLDKAIVTKIFSILIPVETNERASTAQLVAKNQSRIYLKEIKFEHDISEFKEEYLGTQKADSYQQLIIKNKGFCIIPKSDKLQTTLSEK